MLVMVLVSVSVIRSRHVASTPGLSSNPLCLNASLIPKARELSGCSLHRSRTRWKGENERTGPVIECLGQSVSRLYFFWFWHCTTMELRVTPYVRSQPAPPSFSAVLSSYLVRPRLKRATIRGPRNCSPPTGHFSCISTLELHRGLAWYLTNATVAVTPPSVPVEAQSHKSRTRNTALVCCCRPSRGVVVALMHDHICSATSY